MTPLHVQCDAEAPQVLSWGRGGGLIQINDGSEIFSTWSFTAMRISSIQNVVSAAVAERRGGLPAAEVQDF